MQNERKEIRYIDLFGGVGGFSLGLQNINQRFGAQTEISQERQKEVRNSGDVCIQDRGNYGRSGQTSKKYTCVAYYEIDKYAVQTYNKNFGTNYAPTDITKLCVDDIPDIDLICAGFPCQAFSIAGKRKGFEDTRGTLFFEIVRIAKAKKPRYLFLENVKGLFSHNNGETFGQILSALDELGYDVQWQLLNSKHFGVPQNRERVFIIGHLRGSGRPEVFPIGECSQDTSKRDSHTTPIIRALQGGGHSGGHHSGMTILAYPIDANYGKGTNTLKDSRRTLALFEGRIRRLTPLECERLQGFPDNWTAGVSDTQRYKQMGNAVTVNVIEAIGQRLQGEIC